MLPGPLDTLSVVVPVYNEQTWIRTSLEALFTSAATAALALDVVVVDDGSTDGTPEVLAELARELGIRVVSQANAGRVAARATGLAAARGPWVLLLDSRVVVKPDALQWIRAHLAEYPDRVVWCGHIDVEGRTNPYAAFWSGLVKIGWRRYTADPRLVSFGAEEFDQFPKGTGCLLVPVDLLRDAMGRFASLYDDPQLASDDTRLLRDVAGRERIWLSPDFAFVYHGKAGGRSFVRQSYFRGTTFVDGYLGQPGAVRRALLAAIGGGAVVAAASVRKPAVAVAGAAAVFVAVPTVVRHVGGSADEIRAAAKLTPVFVPVFGAGVVRGLVLAATRLLRTRSAAGR